MLADAINFPLVVGTGVALFLPLVLLVTFIEWLVLRIAVASSARGIYLRLLWANILSTLAGGFVWAVQNDVIAASGIDASIPDFARGYRSVAAILIIIYFAKSVVVETLVVATRSFARRLERPRLRLLQGVILGNIASYFLVGPLFYLATRPTFGNLELHEHTRWTLNPDVAVYFIDSDDRFINRIRVDGSDEVTVVPAPAAAFLVSEDESTFAFRGVDGNLYAYRLGTEAPILIWQTRERFQMDSVTVSPDNTKIAFAAPSSAEPQSLEQELRIFDLDRGETYTVAACQLSTFWPFLSWSRSGQFIYGEQGQGQVVVVEGRPPWSVVELRDFHTLPPSELPLNYVRSASARYATRDDWGPDLREDTKDSYSIRCVPGLGAQCAITRRNVTTMRLADGHGLMKLGRYNTRAPTFLPEGTEVLLEWWGGLYVLDIDHRRMGLLTPGGKYVAPLERFRVNRQCRG